MTHPDLPKKIADLAKKNGVVVLGTGVNPGFLMDYLSIVVSGICRDVRWTKVPMIQADARYAPLSVSVEKTGVSCY